MNLSVGNRSVGNYNMLILQNRRVEKVDLTCWGRSEDWLKEVKGVVGGCEGNGGRKVEWEKESMLSLEGEYRGT